MDYTAAKRMAAFRARMREKGFKQKQIWVDSQGFPGLGGPDKAAKKNFLDRGVFLDEVQKAIEGTDEAFARRLYGELAAYARGLRELWNLDKRNPSLFSPEDLEPGPGC
jgi:hypothetical protein